jgi:hypothetical protein
MGLFGKILAKLGIGHEDAPAPAPSIAPPPPRPAPPPMVAAAPVASAAVAVVEAAPPAPPPVVAITLVDVVAQLEKRAAENPQKLNWRTSIVDLLKLLDLDSSLTSRKELATELGCPANLMGDSAQMNMWLHKQVLAHIAANGGNIPKELLE